jgi:hypothetical protein
MKVGEVYVYDSYYSTNMIKIREIYFDTFYKRSSIKFDELESYFDNNKIYYVGIRSMGIELLKDSISFKRTSKKRLV